MRSVTTSPFCSPRTGAAPSSHFGPSTPSWSASISLGLPPHPDAAEEGLKALDEILKAARDLGIEVAEEVSDLASLRQARHKADAA